ncbi:MAG: hypothetical protein K6E20_04860 [Acholeplasmatales bacterium]|nr:hypothetical protein [Acholeplasmatales bacterium]
MQQKQKFSTVIAVILFLFVFQAIGTVLIILGAVNENKNVLYVGLGVVLFNVVVFSILIIIAFFKYVFKKYYSNKGE